MTARPGVLDGAMVQRIVDAATAPRLSNLRTASPFAPSGRMVEPQHAEPESENQLEVAQVQVTLSVLLSTPGGDFSMTAQGGEAARLLRRLFPI